MPEADRPHTVHTVLGFDFGLKRIGLAAGDTLTRTAASLTVNAALVAPSISTHASSELVTAGQAPSFLRYLFSLPGPMHGR